MFALANLYLLTMSDSEQSPTWCSSMVCHHRPRLCRRRRWL